MLLKWCNKLSAFAYKNPVLLLLLCFGVSVLIRLPNLNRPLSKHHELNAGLVLINAEEWERKTPSFYHYVPVHSYHNPGDAVETESNGQNHGFVINTSFGSLWYIIPYYFFRLLHSPPSPLLLQLFNLFLHLISVVLIYRLALFLFGNTDSSKSKAIVTSAIYLFSPAPLWFHGNGYVHEIAVLPFIFAAALVYLNIVYRKFSTGKCALLILLIIAGINCDWLMCFVAAAMFINCLIAYIKTRNSLHLSMLINLVFAVITGVAIIVWQFSSFMGFENYMQSLLSRFLSRGINGDMEGGGLSKGIGIFGFYVSGYGLLAPLIVFSFLFVKRFRQSIQNNKLLRGFIISSLAISLLHHIIFRGFSNIHDYSVLKSGVFMSLLMCIALFSFRTKAQQMAVFAIIFVANIGIYYFINRPGNYAANGQPYTYFKSLGESVKAIAKPVDYIFTDTPEMSLLLTYYSKRTYKNAKDLNEAENLFKALPGKNALFIHTNNFEFVNAVRLRK